jgi:hypothetical protein
MRKTINGHAVYGKNVMVNAVSEDDAKILAVQHCRDYWSWAAEEVSPGRYQVYIAKHENCFALND